jgi:hypothetical protein
VTVLHGRLFKVVMKADKPEVFGALEKVFLSLKVQDAPGNSLEIRK